MTSSYPCETCNGPIHGRKKRGAKDKKYCSKECLPFKGKVEKQCSMCGKSILRREGREHYACSLECQRAWALKVKRHVSSIDWLKRSVKARAKWERESSRKRLAKWGVGGRLARHKRRVDSRRQATDDPWGYSIETRLASGRGRVPFAKGSKRSARSDFDRLDSVASKRRRFSQDEWDRKIGNKLSNITQRRRRKDENRKTKQGEATESQAEEAGLQMCFEWARPDA